MDFRSLIPLAPAPLRPALVALADRLDRGDRRADELERRVALLEARAIPGANHPPL